MKQFLRNLFRKEFYRAYKIEASFIIVSPILFLDIGIRKELPSSFLQEKLQIGFILKPLKYNEGDLFQYYFEKKYIFS